MPLFIAHVVRFFPQYARAKALMDAGELGRPGVLRTIRAGSFPRPDSTTWYEDFERSGGVVMDLSIHDLDFARWIFGEVERVYARGLTFTDRNKSDHCLITLRFKNGAIGHIEGSWGFPPGQFNTALEIAGEGTLLEWDSRDGSPLTVQLDQNKVGDEKVPGSDSPLYPTDDPYYQELKHVLECLEADEPFLVTPQDGLMALKLSLAAIESVKTGQPVTLEGFHRGGLGMSARIGFISFAHMHAFSYASALRKLGITAVGIYDDDAARGQKMAEQFGTRFFSDLDALLAEGLDGVIICSENINHQAHVEAAAGRVPYILCEKPIATTLRRLRP